MTHMLAHIRLVWAQLLSDSEVFSERSDVVAPQDGCLPNSTSTSEAHCSYCKSVILKKHKWCSKPRVALFQQWGLRRKTWTQYPPRVEKTKKSFLTYINLSHKMTLAFVNLQKDF